MPIWMRNFHINRISEHIKEQNDQQAKAEGKSQMGDGEILRPNVTPSSTYNY
jgi:hypothetical protein